VLLVTDTGLVENRIDTPQMECQGRIYG
jgi:hypothetical protein